MSPSVMVRPRVRWTLPDLQLIVGPVEKETDPPEMPPVNPWMAGWRSLRPAVDHPLKLPAERSRVSGSTTSTPTRDPDSILHLAGERLPRLARGHRPAVGSSLDPHSQGVEPALAREDQLEVRASPAVRDHQLLELRGEDVDATQDDHVVAAAGHFLHAPERRPGGSGSKR